MARCGWCGVELRWFQRAYCGSCRRALALNLPSPPFHQKSRWDAQPDSIRGNLARILEGR